MLENSLNQRALGPAVSFSQPSTVSTKPTPIGGHVRKPVCCAAQFSAYIAEGGEKSCADLTPPPLLLIVQILLLDIIKS